jgi:hypothetical protein
MHVVLIPVQEIDTGFSILYPHCNGVLVALLSALLMQCCCCSALAAMIVSQNMCNANSDIERHRTNNANACTTAACTSCIGDHLCV